MQGNAFQISFYSKYYKTIISPPKIVLLIWFKFYKINVFYVGYLQNLTVKIGIKNPATFVVTGFIAPISESVHSVGASFRN